MLRKFKKKAQSTAEYSILFALVVAAAVGMSDEVRRGIQAKIHYALTDELAPAGNFGGGQYEPQRGNKHQAMNNTKDVTEHYVDDENQVHFWEKDAFSNVIYDSQIRQ